MPVPIGRMPNTTFYNLIYPYITRLSTQGIVPSPPQIINRKLFYICWDNFFIPSIANLTLYLSNKSNIYIILVIPSLNTYVNFFVPNYRYFNPYLFPLFVFTNKKYLIHLFYGLNAFDDFVYGSFY